MSFFYLFFIPDYSVLFSKKKTGIVFLKPLWKECLFDMIRKVARFV